MYMIPRVILCFGTLSNSLRVYVSSANWSSCRAFVHSQGRAGFFWAYATHLICSLTELSCHCVAVLGQAWEGRSGHHRHFNCVHPCITEADAKEIVSSWVKTLDERGVEVPHSTTCNWSWLAGQGCLCTKKAPSPCAAAASVPSKLQWVLKIWSC